MRPAVREGDDGAGLKKLILAIADYVDGEGELPPEVAFYLNTRDWGDPWGAGWMKWPALSFVTAKLVRNVYNAWLAYTSAESRVKWLNSNPAGAQIVGVVKSYRNEEEKALSRVERWELWNDERVISGQWADRSPKVVSEDE